MRYAVLFAFLCTAAGCSVQRDRVIYQRYAGFDNYCHTKVETQPRGTVRPDDREVIDYYGPCDAFD
jgi:hypothetical protein